MKGKATSGNVVSFGEYGLQAQAPAWIDSRQIEAARRAMTHEMRRGGKVWIRIFPDKPVTAKPAETRMGSGKGNPEKWVAVVKPNRVPLRDRGRARGSRARGSAPRCPQAPHPHEGRPARRVGDLAMPNQKATAVREWDEARLDNEINEAYRALFTLRFQQATRQLQNYRALRDAKRTIARLRTIKRERQLAQVDEASE